jgi:voltage-gated potassium channel
MNSHTLKNEMNREKMLYGVTILLTIIISGALFFHIIEWHSLFDSFYFVMMTMTTVWYGDIVPQSHIWKILTIIYALTWIPLFVFLWWFIVEQRITTLVKAHIKQHTHQMWKIETEIVEINEEVEEINEEVEEIGENIAKIKKKM